MVGISALMFVSKRMVVSVGLEEVVVRLFMRLMSVDVGLVNFACFLL